VKKPHIEVLYFLCDIKNSSAKAPYLPLSSKIGEEIDWGN